MISYWNKVSTEIVSSYSLNVNCTTCLTQEVEVDCFGIPSTCKYIYSVTYWSIAVSPSQDPYLSSSWSACQPLSHLQVPLSYVYSFFRSLTNILTNTGIVTDCLFCLSTSFSNMRILTTPLDSLLPNDSHIWRIFFLLSLQWMWVSRIHQPRHFL